MIREIGSEFWNEQLNNEENDYFNWNFDIKYLLSGRTAIDYIIKDIKKGKDIKTVYMPSYCCNSMIQPFISNDIEVLFYEVDFDNGLKIEIDTDIQCDLFFAMNYFGYYNNEMEKYIQYYKNKNVIIIEDSTHSLLSDKVLSEKSDYVIASLRKWFPIYTGGVAIKIKGKFANQNLQSSEELELVKLKKIAMQEKFEYINNNLNINKQYFLEKYKCSNKCLEKNYENYLIDKESFEILKHIDIKKHIEKRRKNVKVIYDNLHCNKDLKFMFEYNKNIDVPLFVPIIVDKSYRNELKQYLVERNIYFPIHWEKLEQCNYSNDIYDTELSLVCDQRYNSEDIKYYIEIINNFFERKL